MRRRTEIKTWRRNEKLSFKRRTKLITTSVKTVIGRSRENEVRVGVKNSTVWIRKRESIKSIRREKLRSAWRRVWNFDEIKTWWRSCKNDCKN